MEGRQIRDAFLRFFEDREHRRVPSSSLIPPPGSGLLLTIAGMNQFIPYFLGHAPAPFPRAVTVQKCFRTLDIDNVGHTARHLTFFEMLGNFSFGDYFKAESCAWGFELVTEVFGIEPDRLWVSVFQTDDETVGIWRDIGIPAERIVRRGKDDNYWSTHAAGPGGPCSEIFVDRGSRFGAEGGPDVDEDRYMEVWNHVFMQDEVDDEENVLRPLPAKNIDTGASVERFATILQDVDSVFETDLLAPLVEVGESLSGRRHGDGERVDVSLKVVAEHGRATTFLIADGVLPSNEGRGYVLRRMLRRAVSHARRLGIDGDVMPRLVATTTDLFGDAYPELVENRAYVEQVATSEEERFAATLRQGLTLLESEVDRARDAGRLAGGVVFKLHDTFGFPKELTRELADEAGLELDEERFDELMAEQRERAKKAAKRGKPGEELADVAAAVGRSTFVGYERLDAEDRVLALLADGERVPVAEEGAEVRLVLGTTPFYAESGGQVGDHGTIRTPEGLVRVTDVQFGPGDTIVHLGVVESGLVRDGDDAHAVVDEQTRAATARSHTATHITHWTLRNVLGEHARQAGSLVAPGRLRFDFSHHQAMSPEQLEEAELEVNRRLAEDDAVRAFETTFDEARRLGAMSLFGEKYGDLVRVVEVGEYSRELCGGTHVPHTGRIALVRFLHESSIGAGLRRVEALVGPDALREVNLEHRLLADVAEAVGAGGDLRSAPERARAAMERLKQLKNELGKLRRGERDALVTSLIEGARQVEGVTLVVSHVPDETADGLRELALGLRDKLSAGGAAAVLGTVDDGKALVVGALTGPLVERGLTATALLEEAARAIGGGAGGKPFLGFAGGKDAGALDGALERIPARLAELLASGA